MTSSNYNKPEWYKLESIAAREIMFLILNRYKHYPEQVQDEIWQAGMIACYESYHA